MPAFARRRLLISGTAAIAYLAMRPWRSVVEIVEPSRIELLAGLLHAGESTRRVGRAYLRAHPDEAQPEHLAEALTRSLGVPASAGRAELASLAARAIQHELRSRIIIRLEGWIASPTEARLAALTTLASASPRSR